MALELYFKYLCCTDTYMGYVIIIFLTRYTTDSCRVIKYMCHEYSVGC